MITVNKADLPSASFVSELNPLFRREGSSLEAYRNIRGSLIRLSGTQVLSALGLQTRLGLSVRYSDMEGVRWSEDFIRIANLDSVDKLIEDVRVATRPVDGVPDFIRLNPGLVLAETTGSLHSVRNFDAKDTKGRF